MDAFLHGLILALGLILPLGVQNIFIFSQGATQPTLSRALPAVVTASICDSLLIVASVFGLSYVFLQLDMWRTALMMIGIVFLLYMSVSIWRSEVGAFQTERAMSAKKQVMFAMSVSFLNPHAILDTVGVIGTSALAYDGSDVVLFTVACVSVSWVWFFSLLYAGSTLQKLREPQKIMRLLNKCSAVFIFAMALYLATTL